MNSESIFKLNLTTRLFWIISVLVVVGLTIDTLKRYSQTKEAIELEGYNRAKALNEYLLSMRYVYHQQFLKSGIDLNDSTVGFLPAHASTLISDEFSKRTTQGITIRNVSDRPRNQKNRADKLEAESIAYFKAYPEKTQFVKTIVQNGEESLFFSEPLKIVPYCLACHGEIDKVNGYIKDRYNDTAYGYKVGDIRGVTSIKIPKYIFKDPAMKIFLNATFINFGISLLFLAFIYIVIRRLTYREAHIKQELEVMVKEKTTKLENAYLHEKHLRSVLRTVADVNQVLITAKSIEELIDQAASALSLNDSFSSVKIAIMRGKALEVMASYSPWNEKMITKVDIDVFESAQQLLILDLKNDSVPEFCREKAELYGISTIYSTPLKSNSFAKESIGVMTICTTMENGFSDDDINMLDELAGDIGFAINSFIQQDALEFLREEKIKRYQDFIEALVEMIEQRDTYTAGHTARVAEYSSMIATELGLSEKNIKDLVEAAKIHDIGKVVTPDSVLLKPGALTKLEYDLIKEHVIAGYEVLSNIDSYKELAEIVLLHHERFDGSGYPYGKQGDEISLSGCILAIADSFDAMTTNRIYKPRKSVEIAIAELKELSGSHYHPLVVAAATKVLADVKINQIIDQIVPMSEIEKERLSYFFQDRLTKLYNEEYFTLVVDGRSGYQIPDSLSVISLSNFTKYNREKTWDGGNKLLIEFAEFLKKEMNELLVFRIWGDRFVVADCNLDLEGIMTLSPLIKNNISYKIKTIKAPFKNIKEEILREL
ncbi:HD domain-containing phosphohydrolase [Sulfurimonas sp.]|uniref:HD domain-containing phosphohydrolase n=1 Tax=Sulfurimonas sp. TaxID=2022749 RepID=UPI0025F86299|nr:HD domain-containing phosphohydrolase [Sulfurimonas sp.]